MIRDQRWGSSLRRGTGATDELTEGGTGREGDFGTDGALPGKNGCKIWQSSNCLMKNALKACTPLVRLDDRVAVCVRGSLSKTEAASNALRDGASNAPRRGRPLRFGQD